MNFIDAGMSIEDYHAHTAISRSGLLLFRKSPLHYFDKYIAKNSPDKDSKALVFGNAFHTFVLEPEEFKNRFGLIPDVDRRTKDGKILYGSFLAALNGKQPISKEDYSVLEKMANAVKNYDLALELITDCKVEHSLFWIENETKMLCKARPDIWHLNMIVDLKTTADASPHAFQRQIGDYGYHIQAAMMQDAIYTITGKFITEFVFLAVEKEPPFAIGIYQLSEEAIAKGREEFIKYLKIYKECLTNNHWPSYEIKTLSLPAYYFSKE